LLRGANALATAAAAGDQAHRRAQAAAEHEPGSSGDDRQLVLEAGGDGRRSTDLLAEVLDRDDELLPLRLDVRAQLLRSTARHRLLIASVVRRASSIASAGTGGEPFLKLRIPSQASSPVSTSRPSVTASSDNQVARKVASAAAIVENRKAIMKTPTMTEPSTY